MFCPRCGKPNEEGARYCSACGGELPELGEEAAEASRRPSLRERMGRVIGRSRRERLISAGIAIALVIAIAAVIAISTGGSEDTDAYVEKADRMCIESTQALAVVGNRVSETQRDRKGALALYAGAAAEIAGDWRSRLAGLDPPPDSKEASARLDEALAKFKDEADEVVIRTEAGQDPRRLRTQLAAAGSRTQEATDALGLDGCAEAGLAIGKLDTG